MDFVGFSKYRSVPSVRNVVKVLQSSERDGSKIGSLFLRRGIRRMVENQLFEEYPLPTGTSAILCSEWLSDKLVAAGTRCNNLLVYDVVRNSCTVVPSVPSTTDPLSHVEFQKGIFDLAKNPCKNLLATSGFHSSDVVVYSIPSFRPLCVGKNGHGSEIYGLKWVDDEILLSGAADGTLTLWLVSQKESYRHELDVNFLKPLAKKWCKMCGPVRALEIQSNSRLLVLSDNFLHEWDLNTFRQISSHRLPFLRRMRVMAHCADRNLYAIGSKSHLTLLDGSSLAILRNVITLNEAKLSLSVQGDILSYCTGYGAINFYDTVAGRVMDCSMGVCHVDTALYTHSYDWSGTKMFVGGSSSIHGSLEYSPGEDKSFAALLQ